MFTNYIKDHQLADYVTASTGECFAVREVCELLLASIGMYDDAVENRINFSDTYAKYIAERNTIETKAFLPEKNY
jgi:3-deoxy-D-manno-octulosonate 8-phosphate phosphatase (KDO 8-P phosphatase)